MDELLSEFLTETSESLSMLDGELIRLEKEPDDPGLIDNIFRLVHTIKGTCGFLGLPRLEKVAHSSENVLGKIRDHELVVTPEAVSLILESLDQIKDLLAVLEETEAEPAGDDSDLILRLDTLAVGTIAAAPSDEAEVVPAPEVEAEPEPVSDAVVAPVAGFDDALGRDLKAGEVSLAELERIFQETESDTPAPEVEVSQSSSEETKKTAAKEKPIAAESSVANQSIRVSVDLLENLMTMVSELVLTRNQLLQLVRGHVDSEFQGPLQQLSHVTTELQEGVMKTRMQPVGNAWAKLPRIIRDLSHELGKKIELEMIGADTELDRQVLELIKDPLTHMVRNSADHGLEGPEERLAAGKGETGKVALNAYHEGGHILIEIQDDGRGINVEKVRQKIIEKGLAPESEVEEMTPTQIQQFIFNAGFSTAAEVTSVSGRGVGMDVVRTNIEKIGGTVDLKSDEGKGSLFTIKIPLTLAIVSALIVECCKERFAIPQLSVIELVRASKDSEHRVEIINNTPVLRIRDRLLPLIYLGDALKLNGADEAKLEGDSEVFVVVTQVGNYTYGVVVDQVFDTEEIVVKPVAPILRDISLFSGNTILGDGSVIMILDPNGIATATSDAVVAEHHAEEETQQLVAADNEAVALLVFHAGSSEPKAVPLSLVARLEEVDVTSIEMSNDKQVVQYRGKLMPLVKIDDSYEIRTEGRQPVLVFSDNDRSMGLVVDEIVDIVEDELDVEIASRRTGFLGSAVVAGNATEMVDVGHYLTQAFTDWFGREELVGFGEESKSRLLLVDDSPFFRNMLTPLLQVAGYKVTTANDPMEALDMRERGQKFDVIVSDIEMPNMNGFEFAEAIKMDTKWDQIPLIALTSHTSASDFERGREVGFTDYVAKLDRDALLKSLSQSIVSSGAKA